MTINPLFEPDSSDSSYSSTGRISTGSSRFFHSFFVENPLFNPDPDPDLEDSNSSNSDCDSSRSSSRSFHFFCCTRCKKDTRKSEDDQESRKIDEREKERWLQNIRDGGIRGYTVLASAPEEITSNKDFMLRAIEESTQAFSYASWELCADREVVIKAVQRHGSALGFACEKLQADREVVLEAVRQDGDALTYASDDLRTDREVVLEAVKTWGDALRHASDELRADREVVVAAVQQWGNPKPGMNREDLLAIVQSFGNPLQYASYELQANREVVLEALKRWGDALKYASYVLQQDREIVMKAVQQNGRALEFASKKLRCNKDIVLAAVHQEPTALKFALGSLNQDRECLTAAGLFDEHYDSLKLSNVPRIVLSTKFSLGEKTTSYATLIALQMKENPFFKSKIVYSPNAWDKNTCDPDWTNIRHECRGTPGTCGKYLFDKDKNIPIEHQCCWRASFRFQLEKAKATSGFMVQVAEFDSKEQNHVLGNGQQIETKMAEQVGVKVFRINQQKRTIEGPHKSAFSDGIDSIESISKLIEELVELVDDWCNSGRSSMAVKNVQRQDSELSL